MDYPLTEAMASWRKLGKFKNEIDNIDNPEASKVCNYRRIDTRGILQHVRDNLMNVYFTDQLNSTLSTTLMVLKNIYILLVKVELVTTPCTLQIINNKKIEKPSIQKKTLLQIKILLLTFVK